MADVTVTVTPTANASVVVSSTVSASSVTFDSTTSDLSVTDLQNAVAGLANEKFVQDAAPTVGVTEGDLWYDADDDVLNVRRDTSWVELVQENLTGGIDGGSW